MHTADLAALVGVTVALLLTGGLYVTGVRSDGVAFVLGVMSTSVIVLALRAFDLVE